jgi:hypothetical protein
MWQHADLTQYETNRQRDHGEAVSVGVSLAPAGLAPDWRA